jgi:hypothetical protein
MPRNFKMMRVRRPRSLRVRDLAVVGVTLLVLFAGLGRTYWLGSGAASTHTRSLTSTPQATPTPPLILTKEYIYAGNKLLATKEMALLEADIAPRPEGSGHVSVTDWVQVGRFVAGLDIAASGGEFQRVDCAPRSSSGNGAISVSDWVQAGRYAAGLDAPQYSAGPVSASARLRPNNSPNTAYALIRLDSGVPSLAQNLYSTLRLNRSVSRVVRIVSATFTAGQNGTVLIELDSQGDENAVGLSLNFVTSQLTYVSAVKGSGASAASLNVNSSGASTGKIGIALSMPSGQTFSSGTKQLVVVTFNASTSGSHVVSSGNQPVYREVADVDANSLATTFSP